MTKVLKAPRSHSDNPENIIKIPHHTMLYFAKQHWQRILLTGRCGIQYHNTVHGVKISTAYDRDQNVIWIDWPAVDSDGNDYTRSVPIKIAKSWNQL